MDLLEEGLARHQPRYAEGLARIAMRVLDLPNDSYHRQLSRIYEPQMKHIYIDELTRRLNDGRERIQLAAWDCLLLLVEANIPWANELAEYYWPVEQNLKLSILNQAGELTGNQWVAEKMLELLPHTSVPQLIDLLRYSSSISHMAELDLLPEQKGMLDVLELNEGELTAEIQVFKGNLMRVNIVPTFSGHGSRLHLFSELDDCDPTWSVFKTSAEFLMDPSKESLATALREIASSLESESFQQQTNWFARIPWPISASIAHCSDTSEIYQLSERALSGALGESSHWAAAEKRWLENGVMGEDILSMSQDRLPFDNKIGELGFPPTLSALSRMFIGPGVDQMEELMAIYNKLGKGMSRSHIAEMLLFLHFHLFISGESRDGQAPDIMNSGKLREILVDLIPESRIPLEIIVSQLNCSTEEIVELFADLERRKIRFIMLPIFQIQSQFADGIDRLLEAFASSPSGNELLPVMGALAEEGQLGEHTLNIPKRESLDNADQRIDSFVILLSQHSWDADNTEELVEIAREVHEISDKSLRRALNTLRMNRSNGDYLDKFLLELGEIIPEEDLEAQTQFMNLLENSLRRRVSKFADPTKFKSFSMPKGINALIWTQNREQSY